MSRRPPLLAAVLSLVLVIGLVPANASPRLPRSLARGPALADLRAPVAPRAPVPARAFSVVRTDGNDTKGPLDLASARIIRGRTSDTIAFSLHSPVSNTAMHVDNGNFAILIDINDNERYDFAQYVFYYRGKLRGLLVNLKTDRVVDSTVPTSRTSPKAFRQVVQRSKIDSPGTYRFVVIGYYQGSPCSKRNPCADAIPNRFPLIALDHRDPSFSWRTFDTYAADGSAALRSVIEFHVEDDAFGTGIKQWMVQRRRVGGGTGWGTVKKGGDRNATVNVPSVEGASYDIRVIVFDKQKNSRISSVRRATIPYDDDAATYDPLVTQEIGQTGWFLGTRSGISNNLHPEPPPLMFDGGVGAEVCVMGGPVGAGLSATADVTLDGLPPADSLTEDETTPVRERLGCYTTTTSKSHTLEVTATSVETIWIDGSYVVP